MKAAGATKYVDVDCRVWSLRATSVPWEVQTHIRAGQGGMFPAPGAAVAVLGLERVQLREPQTHQDM